MPAPDHTPAHYSPRAEAIYLRFAKPLNLSLEELILREVNDNGKAIRELAPEWGCSVSLLSQIIGQLGIRITRHSQAEVMPRGGKALR